MAHCPDARTLCQPRYYGKIKNFHQILTLRNFTRSIRSELTPWDSDYCPLINEQKKSHSLALDQLIAPETIHVLHLLRNQNIKTMVYGAGERNRTPDRLITNQLLYLLSYASLLGSVERHAQNTCV